jgi:uncharacterized protein
MKIIRIAAVAVALALAGIGCNNSRAEDAPSAEALQAAKELVALITKDTIKELATRVTAQVWPQIEQGLKAKQKISPFQLTELRQEFERIQFEFATKVMADAPALYAHYFTADELRQLLAFYHTPVGEKAMRTMPRLTAEALQLVMARLPQLQADAMDAFTKILKQRGFDI